MTATTRRALLAAAPSLALALPSLSIAGDTAEPIRPDLLLSGGADADLVHHVATIDGTGQTLFAHPLPGRGHAVAVSRDNSVAVICARRSGRFATAIDLRTLSIRQTIEAVSDRHFYGHGVFSADGRKLFATENAFDIGEGRIGVYDVTNGFRRIDEWPSHGIGPHELVLHPDDRTLIVANGGILTHPDSGREPLNLDTMAPNLSFIDSQTGGLLRRLDLPQSLHLLSSRHLAVSRHANVVVVMQYQGDESDIPPLVAMTRDGDALSFRSAPSAIQAGMANYCGSVTYDRSGTSFGVSSPHGDLFTFWNAEGEFQTSVSIADGCGIAPGGNSGSFMMTSGTGGLWRFAPETGHLQRITAPIAPIAHWDNHLTAVWPGTLPTAAYQQ